MKKLFCLALALVLCVSLVACGKATLADLLECPAGSSTEELQKFLKDCGYKIEEADAQKVIFNHGEWRGMATPLAISLSIGLNPDEATVEAMRDEIQAICGDPYNSTATMEFYTDGNSVIVFSVNSGIINNADVVIYPGAAG